MPARRTTIAMSSMEDRILDTTMVKPFIDGHPRSLLTVMRSSAKLFLVALAIGQSYIAVDAFSTDSARRVFVSTPVSKFPKRLVGDCMTGLEDVTALAPMTSTDEAMATLLVSGLSGAPVVNRNKKLVGVVSSFDFLQKEAFEGALLPMEGSRANVAKYVQAAQKICGQVVSDIMTPAEDVKTVTPQTAMRDAAAIMSELKLHRLPVVDERGTLVGVLSSADVMKDLLHIVRNLPPAAAGEATDEVEATP